MKKTYGIEIDCAACAAKVEEAAKQVAGVKELSISFMTQKMKVDYEDGVDESAVLDEIYKTGKKIEPDFSIEN